MSSDKPSGSGFRSSNCSFATITDEDQNEIEDSGLFDVSFYSLKKFTFFKLYLLILIMQLTC